MTDLFTRRVARRGSAVLLALLAACGDDNPAKPAVRLDTCADANGLIAADITTNCHLVASTTYTLKGFRKVTNGATLTIDPGTKIVGDTLTPGSALFITRGSKIDAQGTAAAPIVFTSAKAAGRRRPGDWGGLLLVGNATINRTNPPTPTILTEGPAGENYAGGNNDADNSGTMKYVRVEFGGYAEIVNEELNTFTFYAVGSGTTLDYLQALAGLDDSFEWFGGTVNGKHLISYESGDDHFDWTEGYRGKNQFMIAYQSRRLDPVPPGQPSSDQQGFEGDGCERDKPGCGSYLNTPYSMPVFANFAVIGFDNLISGYPTNGGRGMMLRRGTGGTFVNGIVARWPQRGLNMRNYQTDTLRMRDSLIVRNVLFAENGANFDPVSTTDTLNLGYESKFVVTGSGIIQHTGTAASLFVKLPTDTINTTVSSFDWTPAAGAPTRTGGLSAFTGLIAARAGSFITATAYMGPADPAGTKWWEGWTNYAPR